MKRRTYIERIRRLIYNGQPADDATITIGLVNNYLQDAIAYAVKQNNKESLAIDGVSYVNNSFYTTFKGLTVSSDEQFTWKIALPEIPIALGTNEGITMLQFKDAQSKQISQTVVWLTQAQKSYFQNMRPIPNKIMAVSEGKFVYVYTDILLDQYTANATMVSGGLSTDLDGELNVPADYFPVMTEYLLKILTTELNQPKDVTNDGQDFRITT